MRPTTPLITILPAIPPAIDEIESTRARFRLAVRLLAALLALIALGAALLLLILPASSA